MRETSNDKRIVIIQGDLTEQDCDAIVNAANDRLWMGGGVAGAIKRKGGEEIEREAISKGPVPVGEAIATKAGRLKANYVIHAVTMGQDLQTGSEVVRKATGSALKRAEELGLGSVAFPALGTGVGGFPLEECAEIMLQEADRFLKSSQKLKEIRFVLIDQERSGIFKRKLQEIVGKKDG